MGWIYWNPDNVLFTLPYFGHPVTWYGILFALSFLAGYYIIRSVFTRRLKEPPGVVDPAHSAAKLADKLMLYLIIATVVGARLGEVFFYDWPYYRNHLAEIPMTWRGGLASHGGAIGILIGLCLYRRVIRKQFPRLTFMALLDSVVIPAALIATFIRIANFINQEILGTVTSVPWAVVFGNPVEGPAGVPRHPVQLYEASVYFLTFIFLMLLWKRKGTSLKGGLYTGLFLTIVFSSRFILEWFKVPQTHGFLQDSPLAMGQYLSLPLILGGLILLIRKPTSSGQSYGSRSEKLSDTSAH